MTWQSPPEVPLLLLVSGLLWVNAGYLVWRRQAGRRTPGQLLAAGLMSTIAVSLGAFGLQLTQTTKSAQIFWNQVLYIGDAPMAALFLAYVLVYLDYEVDWRHYIGLFALPVIVLIGASTNSLHKLHWVGHTFVEVDGYMLLGTDAGPLFWLYVAYSYAFLSLSLALLTIATLDPEGGHRRHHLALIAGALFPAIAGIIYVLELGPAPTPNYVGYAYIGSALTLSYTVYRHDLFAAVPIARRTTLEQLDDGLVTLGNSGLVVSVNEAAKQYLDKSEAELLGQPGREALGGFADVFDLETDNPQQSTIETEYGVFGVSIQPLVRGDVIVGRQLVLSDITERHRREKRLEQLHARLELALKETDTGVWEIDLDTEELVFDETSERLYGYKPGEFPNTVEAFADRLSDEDFETVEARIESAINGDGGYSADFKIKLPDGSHRWVEAHGVVQYDDEEPNRILGIQSDISDRKRVQERLEDQNRRLALLNRLIRHDIRNEANLITVLASTVQSTGTDSSLDPDIAAQVDQIAASGDRIIDLTQQAKSLMTVITSMSDSLRPVPLRTTVQSEVAKASTVDGSAQTRIKELPNVDVRANELLGSLFRNLLINAIKHNDKKSPEVRVSGETTDETVCITVSDNGPGIPDAERDAVFTEGKTLAESDGTGFGLYLVKMLVDQYGGEVTIDDAEELGGAAVTVTLQIAR